jgi:hypothetical protein
MLKGMAITPLRAAIGLATLLMLTAASCSPDKADKPTDKSTNAVPATTAAAQSALDGTWKGTWTRTSPPPGNGTVTFVLHVNGQAVTGTVDVGSSACLTKGDISGTLAGTALTMHTSTPAVSGTGQATGDYQGSLNGNKISGTLTVTCSAGVGVGTWEATRQ